MVLFSTMNINSALSGDIIRLIFSKLNIFNLGTCRVACKAWNQLVLTLKSYDPKTSINSNLYIAQISSSSYKFHCVDLDPQHLDKINVVASFRLLPSLTSIGPVKILNSCNGLLLIQYFWSSFPTPICNDVYILNPITNEYMKVSSSIAKYYNFGIGFSLKTKRYKILRYHYVRMDIEPIETMQLVLDVLALGTNSPGQWTHVGSVPSLEISRHGTYFNGALYWIGFSAPKKAIFRFNVEDEKFEEISFPWDENPALHDFLGVLNGSLYLTFKQLKFGEYEVWKMGEDCSWIKAFVVPKLDLVPPNLHYHLQLIKTCEDGKMLCFYNEFDFMLYDPKSETIHILTRQDVETKEHLLLYQIDCFNFEPLHKILAGDGC